MTDPESGPIKWPANGMKESFNRRPFVKPRRQLPQLAGCVILDNNHLLLMQRTKTGWFELPGGKVEPNESAWHAAWREANEELGVKVRIVRELGKDHFFQNGCKRHYTWFLAELIPGLDPVLGEPKKFTQLVRVPVEKLGEMHLGPNMKKLWKKISSGKIELPMDGKATPAVPKP